jgi:SAM-dependent methyltransferase
VDGSSVDARSVERDLVRYYDQEADRRAGRPLEAGREAARAQFVDMLGPSSSRVLEIGPGAGRDSGPLVAAGLDVVGVDLSVPQLVHAAARGLRPVTATVRQLPFPDATFGAVWTMSTLMHVPDSAIEGALGELGRVLTPGGLAAIGVWGGPDVEDHGDQGGPRLFSRRSDDRWRSLLGGVGAVEVFENWQPDTGDFWYQWAMVRRS